jgi:hypothetical protein
LTGLWVIAMELVFDLRMGLSDPWDRGTPIGIGVAAGVIGLAVMRLMLHLRQPKGARVTWDGSGITKWDGEDRGVTIPWSKARVSDKTLVAVDRSGQKVFVAGEVCQISDEAGNLIELSHGTEPMWMNGRRNSADYSPLTPYFEKVPKIDPIRGPENRFVLMWITAIAAYVCLALGLGIFCQSHAVSVRSQDHGALLILAGALCLFLRSLWPLFSGLRARGDSGSKRAWRRANLIEFGLRVILAAVAALPALGVLGVGSAPPSFKMVKMGSYNPKTCVVTADGARLEKGEHQEILWTRRAGGSQRHRMDADYTIDAMALDPGDHFAAFKGLNKTVMVWDGSTGRVTSCAEKRGHHITSMVFSPRGNFLATASSDKTVKLWDPRGVELLHTLSGHAAHVGAVAFSPNGKQLAVGSFKQVILWDVETGRKVRSIEGLKSSITALAFTDDGGRLAVGGYKGSLSLVDVAAGKRILDLEPHEQRVKALRFLRGGRHLISASSDQTIRFHAVETGEQAGEVDLRANQRILETRDYANMLHAPRGTAFQAITRNCATLEIELPPEVSGKKPGEK